MKISQIVTLLAILCSSVFYAQQKQEQKALEMAKEFNAKLGSAKLSTEQEQKLATIFTEKLNEIKELKKSQTDEEKQKEQMKELHKKFAKKIADEVLTKEQKEALKQNKNKE